MRANPLICLVALAGLTATLPALAQGQAPEPAATDAGADQAKALFEEGRELTAKGNIQEACAKFDESQKLRPGIGTLFNLADCNEQLGKTATAYQQYLEVAALTREANQPDREKVANERAQAIQPKLSTVTLQVPANATGLEIRIDGNVLSAAQIAQPIALDPGEHTVSASAPDHEAFSTTVTLSGPGTTAVAIPYESGGGGDDDDDGSPRRSTGKIVAGSILTGLGAISLVGGIALFAQVGNASNDTTKTRYLAGGIIGVALAGALLGPGIPILVSGISGPDEDDEAEEEESSRLRPDLFVGIGSATARWTF